MIMWRIDDYLNQLIVGRGASTNEKNHLKKKKLKRNVSLREKRG